MTASPSVDNLGAISKMTLKCHSGYTRFTPYFIELRGEIVESTISFVASYSFGSRLQHRGMQDIYVSLDEIGSLDLKPFLNLPRLIDSGVTCLSSEKLYLFFGHEDHSVEVYGGSTCCSCGAYVRNDLTEKSKFQADCNLDGFYRLFVPLMESACKSIPLLSDWLSIREEYASFAWHHHRDRQGNRYDQEGQMQTAIY